MEEFEREFFGDSLFGPHHPFGAAGHPGMMHSGPGFSSMHHPSDGAFHHGQFGGGQHEGFGPQFSQFGSGGDPFFN